MRSEQELLNILMSLKRPERQRVLATLTDQERALIRYDWEVLAREEQVPPATDWHTWLISAGRGFGNLPARYLGDIARFNGTVLGRQEVHGEMVVDAEGALWRRELLERCREAFSPEPMARVVVAVDPPASANGDECGIVVAGVTGSGAGKVLADASVAKASPERWAQAVADAARAWQADRVVAEANQGGKMVESVLRAADCTMPVKLVHASRGKAARAEPIAALYEVGKVRHVGMFARLEDQLCGLMAGGGYEGPGKSPDRADALVWALTELMLGAKGEPRVRGL